MKRTIYNAETNETIEVPFTEAETIAFEKLRKEVTAQIEAEQAEAETKATAKTALLAKLNITAEEAALLLS